MNQQQPIAITRAINNKATTLTFHNNPSKYSVNNNFGGHSFTSPVFEILNLVYLKRHATNTLLSASITDPSHSSGMPHQPIRKPQPPPRLDTLPLEEIELTAQVTSSQQTLHQLTQGLKQKKPKNMQRIYEAI